MSQIFIETIARAIGDYRTMLRRHLDQIARRQKLAALNLTDPSIFDSSEKLYDVAWGIVNDIEGSIDAPTGYYAYSGIAEFGKYLREYLESYLLEDGHLIHSAQKASKMMIKAIQYIGLPPERLNDEVVTRLKECNEVVARFGSDEQKDMYEGTLEQKLITQREFYTPIYEHYQQLLTVATNVDFGEEERAVG